MKRLILMASAISLAIGASGCMSKTDQAIATAKENKVITTFAPYCGKPNPNGGYRSCLALAKIRYFKDDVRIKVITGMRVNGDLIVSDGAMILPEDTVEGLIQVEALGHRNDPDSLAKHYLDHTS